ncbi:HupE/UreJ family protein [Propionivibrio sp.]|uniref:HupE/UreJ family protein n=1 Tax=Propionivibrio sp. TaxID=2212460 RepID=UPI00272EB696|nr:HupE/UreJ family protein [Propionivibrio sp.]
MSKRLAALLLTALPLAAFAHTGHGDHTFIDGFTHPFLGLDHLLAMLLVGVWSVLHARHVWLAPLTFVTLLAAGAALGQHGIVVPQLEPLVAASVLVLGVMLTLPFRVGLSAALAVIGGFALFHGMAHGGELEQGSTIMAGIVLGSALLHGLGMGFAHFVLKNRPTLALRLGQLVAVIGGGLVLSTVL